MLKIRNERGSFLVLGIFFVVIFMMVGGVAVDVSRYLVVNQKMQHVADGAALAGARALNQYKDDDPDLSRAYSAVLTYLEDHFGEDYLDLYDVHSSENVDGIEVQEISGGDDIDQYRVGVVVYGSFQPYFFPDRYLDMQLFGTYQVAVAETYYDPSRRVEFDPMDCGMVADGEIVLDGNNFNKNIDGQPANMCANADIDASGSKNGILGDIYTAGEFNPPGGGYGDVRTGEPDRQKPGFKYDYPEHSDYDVVLSDTNFETWTDCGASARREKENYYESIYSIFRPGAVYAQPSHAGPPGGSESKELTTKDGEYVGVCVNRNSEGDFEFDQGTELDADNMNIGDSIGIYVKGSLTFVRNNEVEGGIYATGNIAVESNNNDFIGNPDKLGGLSLWAEGNIDVSMNNVRVEGLTGAEGSYAFSGPPWGGGNVSGFRGVLITGNSFYSGDNSANTRFQYDPELVDYEALNMNGWEEAVHEEVDIPVYTQISARLVN